MFNALEESPAGNDMEFAAKLHLVEKHIRNNNLKLSFAEQLGRASNEANGEVSTQVSRLCCSTDFSSPFCSTFAESHCSASAQFFFWLLISDSFRCNGPTRLGSQAIPCEFQFIINSNVVSDGRLTQRRWHSTCFTT